MLNTGGGGEGVKKGINNLVCLYMVIKCTSLG